MSRDVSASIDMTTKIDKAVVLAAGRGTRMRELTAEVPKPMIQVRGKPVLQHIIEGLRDAGVRDFLIVVGHHADAVQNFFGDGSRYNTAIQYATQEVQDGTGRVVDLARDFVGASSFVLGYGDILVDPANYKRVVDLPDDIEAIVTRLNPRWREPLVRQSDGLVLRRACVYLDRKGDAHASGKIVEPTAFVQQFPRAILRRFLLRFRAAIRGTARAGEIRRANRKEKAQPASIRNSSP